MSKGSVTSSDAGACCDDVADGHMVTPHPELSRPGPWANLNGGSHKPCHIVHRREIDTNWSPLSVVLDDLAGCIGDIRDIVVGALNPSTGTQVVDL